MNNILEERDKDVTQRQRIKKRLDNIINLSESDSSARLLDEGVVVDGMDNIRFIIKKGTMDKFMEGRNEYLPNIDADYKGFINLGHDDFYANPTSLIGEWTMDDLKLVDIGNDRKGIDVDIRLWEWHPTVELLHKLPYSVGISAEFMGHMDFEASDELGYTVYDEICIMDFAVVGNGANANSNGLMLKGETMEKDLKKLQESLEEMDASAEEIEEEIEEVEEEVIEEDEVTEEEVDEESEDVSEESNGLNKVMEQVEALMARVDALESENSSLKEKLSARERDIEDFTKKFPTLSLKLNPNLKTKDNTINEVSRYGNSNDGIGV